MGVYRSVFANVAIWLLDHYVRNESQYDALAYFPLYIFGISFIKWKHMAACQIWSKLYETFFGGYLGIYTALGMWLERLIKFLGNPDTLVCTHIREWSIFINCFLDKYLFTAGVWLQLLRPTLVPSLYLLSFSVHCFWPTPLKGYPGSQFFMGTYILTQLEFFFILFLFD